MTRKKLPPNPASLPSRILRALPATPAQLHSVLGDRLKDIHVALCRMRKDGRIYRVGAVISDAGRLMALWGRVPE